VVVVVGLLLATFLRGVIATSADRVGITYATTWPTPATYVIALMTFIGAFDQLGIQFGLLKELILIAFAAVALGFGLAFGLGGREVMAGILAGILHAAALADGRPRDRLGHVRHGARGRPHGHGHRDRRRRPHQPPQRSQHQDAERGGALSAAIDRHSVSKSSSGPAEGIALRPGLVFLRSGGMAPQGASMRGNRGFPVASRAPTSL